MRLFLVRHGQTAWNAEQRAQGHGDIELDETGRAQALRLAGALADEGIERILASDLKRTVQTATPLAERIGQKIETSSDLRERHFGELEGLNYEQVRAGISERAILFGTDAHAVRPDGGESYLDVWQRVSRAKNLIDPARGTTLIVSHGGAQAILLTHLLEKGVEEARTFRFANASITELVLERGQWTIVRLNDSSHLEEAREGFGSGA
jgi:probable phosphoglycerate mutase